MSVTDTTIMVFIAFIFLYLVIYPKSKFLANIGFIGVGFGIFLTGTTTILSMVGLIVFLGGFASMFIDLLKNK